MTVAELSSYHKISLLRTLFWSKSVKVGISGHGFPRRMQRYTSKLANPVYMYSVHLTFIYEKVHLLIRSACEIARRSSHSQASVSGHTDDTGREPNNLKLSKDLAQSVAVYLLKNSIEENRISFKGWGSSMPVAGNGTEEGRRKNRRVEILISEDF
jgi:hypothetical protein